MSLPLFFIYARLGIIDTHFGLILAYVALNIPFTIWLIDGFFRQVPKDLAEAAQIDGCTRWQAFWQVEFPLAGPGIASAGIFAFLTSLERIRACLAAHPLGQFQDAARRAARLYGRVHHRLARHVRARGGDDHPGTHPHLHRPEASRRRPYLRRGERLTFMATVSLKKLTKRYGNHGGRAWHRPRRRRPRIHRAGRPVGLRQVDNAAHDRRAGGNQRRRRSRSAAGWSTTCRRARATSRWCSSPTRSIRI